MIKYGKGFPMVITVKGLDNAIKNLDKYVKYNNTATRIAINDTARVAKTSALKVTREDWNIKAKDLKEGSKLILAKNSDLHAQFYMKSHSLNLMKFSKKEPYVSALTPTGKKRTGGAGVKYKLKKKRGFNTMNKSFVKPSLFGSKDDTIFTRRPSPTGNANITAQYSITPISMFNQDGLDNFLMVFDKNFTKNYLHQVRRLTK